MVNLFGNGFVGKQYSKDYDCIVNDRNDLTVHAGCNQILFLISTVDNYNVYTNPFIDVETNITTLLRVLENCKNKENMVFNFASSWFVYGQVPSPIKEDSYCDPKGFYSITKRTAEQLLIAYCETFKIKYRILRFANVLGLNDTKVSSKKNALTYLINRLKKGHDIELNDNGNFIRDYIHVSDLCRAINLIITSGELNAIYNVGNQESTNFGDAIRYAKSKIDSASVIKNIPTSAANAQPKSTLMDCSKLRALGYVPQYTARAILDELIAN
jgi:nucleoside-diphosphate-sugar epimerase